MGQGYCCDRKDACFLEDVGSSEGLSFFYPDEICDQQSCLHSVSIGGGARGRLSSDIGKLEADCDLKDLQQARFSLHGRPNGATSKGGSRVSQFFEPCEGDPVCYVHCTEALWPVGGPKAPNLYRDFTTDCEALTFPGRLGGVLEFMASSDFQDVYATVRCGGEELGLVRPTAAPKLSRFECSEFQTSSQSIELVLNGQEASMKLSLGFGLRLRGLDLLTSLRVSHDGSRDGDAEELQLEDVEAWKTSLTLQAAHHGKLYVLPKGFCYRAETCVEFLAHGIAGNEEMDVYVNGLTVVCASDVQLGCGESQRRLFRYVIGPISCEIRSLVLRLRLNEAPLTGRPHLATQPPRETAGMVIDQEYGLRILGQDALPGTTLVDQKSYIMNPYDWSADSPEQRQLRAGRWTWDGYYYLLAYKRSKKLHLPSVPPVTTATAAPLLLGSRKSRAKEDVLDACDIPIAL